jgi:nucleotide sugar dehydrogenase
MEQVCVVGLGKIGLPLAAYLAWRGLPVVGGDINPAVVELVNRGRTPLAGEPDLATAVESAVAAGRLRATTDIARAVSTSGVVIVIVPLGLDAARRPDFTALDRATLAVGAGLRPGTLVVYETTVPVGTTRGRCAPRLAATSGLRPGQDFALAYSPERVMSGRVFADLARYPKLVGGLTPVCADRAVAFYRRALPAPVWSLSSLEVAEFAKLIETTYRDVNIALANEFACYAGQRGLDVQEAIRAANSQPYSHIHQPGLGVGGHCIPVYPYFLLHDTPDLFTLVPQARRVNDRMVDYGLALLNQTLGGLAGQRVLVLGLTYRPGVRETANSCAWPLIGRLRAAGAMVLAHDPLLTAQEVEASGAIPVDLDPPPLVDAVVVQCWHAEYLDLDWRVFTGCRVLLDGRNHLDPQRLTGTGLRYVGIGRLPVESGPERSFEPSVHPASDQPASEGT